MVMGTFRELNRKLFGLAQNQKLSHDYETEPVVLIPAAAEPWTQRAPRGMLTVRLSLPLDTGLALQRSGEDLSSTMSSFGSSWLSRKPCTLPSAL